MMEITVPLMSLILTVGAGLGVDPGLAESLRVSQPSWAASVVESSIMAVSAMPSLRQ